MLDHPIINCPGSAHENAHVDHCETCAPRWGKVPAFVGMSETARWVLVVLAKTGTLDCPGMPDDVMASFRELEKHGYAELYHREVKGKGTVTSFLCYLVTDLGRDAAGKMRRGK